MSNNSDIQPGSGSANAQEPSTASNVLKRADYTALYGPTTKDRVRLADTDLTIEIEADWSGGPEHSGNEMIFGGGKVIRESMGMSHIPRDKAPENRKPVDTVITGALILDWWGVVKADVGIRDGRIAAIGKAYNPETMDPISKFEMPHRPARSNHKGQGQEAAQGQEPAQEPELPNPTNFVVGPSTEVISGNGRILTAGGVDTHVHLICPEQIHEALASGVTTLIGGGTGPAEGSTATSVTPGAWHITRVFESLDEYPVNIGLLGKGSTVDEEALKEQVKAGAIGLKIHEDWGATPAVINAALNVCETSGVQLALHADSLNESGFLESTRAAFARKDGKKRSIHIFHVEGAGGGHAPDMIELVKEDNVLPASTNPTRPLTVNTVKEHIDMMVICHHLNPDIPADMAFADSRLRPSTMAAEDLLHDMGAISMMSSDAQAMGRIGEMVMRTWQTAHVMKCRYGPLPQDLESAKVRPIAKDRDDPVVENPKDPVVGDRDHSYNAERLIPNDNYRARRYVAKYTINPAITHGIDDHVGSVEVKKLADLVLWEPKFFGVKMHMVLKGGQLAYAQVGDANASISTPQPFLPREVWGATGRATRSNSVNFVANKEVADRLNGGEGPDSDGPCTKGLGLGLDKRFVEIKSTRGVTKASMKLNDTVPKSLEVDHNSFEVTIGGATMGDARTELNGATVPRAYVSELPMAQRYFLF